MALAMLVGLRGDEAVPNQARCNAAMLR